MNATIATAPALFPVTLDKAKEYLRVDANDEDQTIQRLLAAATEWVENFTNRRLITQTWDAFFCRFDNPLVLPYPPLSSVTSVKYYDSNGTEQTLGTSIYTVDTEAQPGKVWLAYNQTWPTTRAIPNAVTVRLVAGYGTAPDNVPDSIRTAIKILTTHWYEVRVPELIGASVTEVPLSVKSLLYNYQALGVNW